MLAFLLLKEPNMRILITIFSLFFCTLLSAATLELASGIKISTLNGEVTKGTKNIQLVNGENQLTLEFSGRLQKSGKREYISTVPYLIVIDSMNVDVVTVQLVSKNLNKINQNIDQDKAIFTIKGDGNILKTTQRILPPSSAVFPYSNIPALVDSYNKKNGLIFDSGKVRELKEELSKLNSESNISVNESENSLQLKLWYNRASEEERKNHKEWVNSQD